MTMDIVNILEKLDFSFWQIVVVACLFFLRKELRQILNRVSSLKIGNNEIVLKRGAEIISELSDLKSKLGDTSSSDVEKLIDDQIETKLIGSLINIKKNTSYLWRDLLSRKESRFITRIRQRTFNRIVDELDSLTYAGIIRYTCKQSENYFNSMDGDLVFELEIEVISADADRLIEAAKKY